MCPNSAPKHEYFKRHFFPNEVQRFCDIIVETSNKDLSGNNAAEFLEGGGWKARFSGRELIMHEEERIAISDMTNAVVFHVKYFKSDWITWYKTIGDIDIIGDKYILEYEGVKRECIIVNEAGRVRFEVQKNVRGKNLIDFVSLFRSALTKTQYCIQCQVCVAECPRRSIRMEHGSLYIDDSCVRCHACLKILSGCLYYNSIRRSTSVNSLTGINGYLSVGINAGWVLNWLSDSANEPGNRKTDVMFKFLTDAGIAQNRKLTIFGERFHTLFDDGKLDVAWALALCNLVYATPFKYYIDNIPFNTNVTIDDVFDPNAELLYSEKERKTRSKAQNEFWNGFKIILESNKSWANIGFGKANITVKQQRNGEERMTLNSITRTPWLSPIPEVVLYSLYKFAEACEGYYQFSLTALMDDTIEREGISPSRIFGLDRDTMIRLCNGLAINYPDFIAASFTFDLDTITLRKDKTAQDVLELLR